MPKPISERLLDLVVVIGIFLSPLPVPAQTAGKAEILEIKNDRGGKLRDQAHRLQRLRQTGQPVWIVGDVCYSTCTMYLGLPQTCVSPRTQFGFHAPTEYGRRLDPATFETASRIIMSHYPPVLHDWYMAYGRHQMRGVLKISGADLIRIGASRPCPIRVGG